MKQMPISLQLIDPNCKPSHARAYTVPRSAEQLMQQRKEVVRSLKKTILLIGLLNFQFL
jgi:hypothetical protein